MVHFVEDGGDQDDSTIAPVIPLFGGTPPKTPVFTSEPAQPAWRAPWGDDVGGVAVREDTGTVEIDQEAEAEVAERTLLRKLRTRSLSVREARVVLAQRDLDEETILSILDDFLRLGYLDDAALAEQLVYAATTRKGQGRAAVSQTLVKRGIPRDVADVAIAGLPDDEAERALEFARSKARSMSSLDFDTALRRLSGQLARRGYGGSIATKAARDALAEVGATRSSVRFS